MEAAAAVVLTEAWEHAIPRESRRGRVVTDEPQRPTALDLAVRLAAAAIIDSTLCIQ
jgi:hypothetical protein